MIHGPDREPRSKVVSQADTTRWYQVTRFADLSPARESVISKMRTIDTLKAARLARRLAKCCSEPVICVAGENDEIRIREKRCKSRICPLCRKERARACFCRTLDIVKRMNSPRFITLTIKHSHEPLRVQLMRLRGCFAKLRRRDSWKDHVSGGIYTIEITWNSTDESWHPHIHIIADGSFYSQAELSNEWHRVTGDSYRVDIRRCNSQTQLASYITSYVSKCDDVRRFPAAQLADWALSVESIRLIQTFGSYHAIKIDEDETLATPELRIIREIADPRPIAMIAHYGSTEARDLITEIESIDRRRVSQCLTEQSRESLQQRINAVIVGLQTFQRCQPERFFNIPPPINTPSPSEHTQNLLDIIAYSSRDERDIPTNRSEHTSPCQDTSHA